jgi:hypothetical protein
LTVVLRFDGRRPPRGLTAVPAVVVDGAADIDEATATARRVIVVGSAANLASVLTRLLKTDRLGVEVAHASRWLPSGRMVTGTAQRIPLIRDETGTVVAGAARWLPVPGASTIHGEAVVDDTVLFDGETTEVQIEPLPTMPGLRARVAGGRWVAGRAAQLGTTGAVVLRDGVPVPRPARRSTFYRHTQGWLRVG